MEKSAFLWLPRISRSAFTRIEPLWVIASIAILAALLLPARAQAQAKSPVRNGALADFDCAFPGANRFAITAYNIWAQAPNLPVHGPTRVDAFFDGLVATLNLTRPTDSLNTNALPGGRISVT